MKESNFEKPKMAVLTGNYFEFKYFISEKCNEAKQYEIFPMKRSAEIDGVLYFYAHDVRSFRGVTNYKIFCYGTYYTRWSHSDLDLINQMQAKDMYERK